MDLVAYDVDEFHEGVTAGISVATSVRDVSDSESSSRSAFRGGIVDTFQRDTILSR